MDVNVVTNDVLELNVVGQAQADGPAAVHKRTHIDLLDGGGARGRCHAANIAERDLLLSSNFLKYEGVGRTLALDETARQRG